mmetsp:Transcript_21455/g.49982  ORF Transcript_21455/g.49982 Transcript_21455/m.49982 type:complete len:293 (-) Transcript_21455:52-930(-)
MPSKVQIDIDASWRSLGPFARAAVTVVCAVVPMLLQGCEATTRHHIGFWRAQPTFLRTYSVPAPGDETRRIQNSCMSDEVPHTLKCNGHGSCMPWSVAVPAGPISLNVTNPLLFCKCTQLWADPECGTQRKSHRTTFILSLFFGWLGADQFYLGYPTLGILKLLSLGGCGLWYLFDLVKVATGPVYSSDLFRTADDLQHWLAWWAVFVLLLAVGFISGLISLMWHRTHREHEALALKTEQQMLNQDLQVMPAPIEEAPYLQQAAAPNQMGNGPPSRQVGGFQPFSGQRASLR